MIKPDIMTNNNDTSKTKGTITNNNIDSVALLLTSETLDKFVPELSKPTALGDHLMGLRRFRNSVKWRYHFLTEKEKTKQDTLSESITEKLNDNIDTNIDLVFETNKGLGTNLRAKIIMKKSPPLSNEVESFLQEVKTKLMKGLDHFMIRNNKIEQEQKIERNLS